ncbi:hypothetical protein BGZ63DRAFT_427979 [Mariannaea sp. PMI_226]|nr:hypothetical protein BGZ63DRAFT_427979 [Mariannaea sp. PMI_226]
MGRQPRQRPISCRFCRVRKLRCSRVFPCSNCTSRGLSCPEPQDPPPSQSRAAAREISVGTSGSAADSSILERLERLEALLAVRTRQSEATIPSTDPPSQGVPSSPPQTLPQAVQHLTAEALYLERNCFGPKLSDCVLGDSFVFRICPIRLITHSTSSYVFQSSNVPSSSLSFEPTKCFWLPQRHEMKILVDKYVENITYIRHIIHTPTTRALVDEVYDNLEEGIKVSVGSIVLFLAIAADITYSWTLQDQNSGLFGDYIEANSQSSFWLKAASDLLDSAQRDGHMSIECVQGILILSFVICNLEGISIRARSNISKAVIMARELGLHRIDHPNNGPLSHTAHWTECKLEVGRRIWWYLAATDWLAARFPGPHEGTYFIHPSHMAVRKPLNVDDETLMTERRPLGLPLEQATCMSYFLQRVRLAELSRDFMDRLSLAKTDPSTLAYDTVKELDEALDRFTEELPPCFTFSATRPEQIFPTNPRQAPSIIIQRHVVNMFVHGQRCKLHLPYLVRGSIDPEYARSREICLQMAKTIIEMEHQLEREDIPFVSVRLRLTVALHSVFIASIVLLIDLCLVSDTEDKSASREQMEQIWRILDDARNHSIPAAKLQDLLRQAMKKHKVPCPLSTPRDPSSTTMETQDGALPLTPASGMNGKSSIDTPLTDSGLNIPELENFDSSMDLDGIDWDSILWGLDAPPGPFV